jgi:hypothetical membrane protein
MKLEKDQNKLRNNMNNKAFGGYTAVFGFALLIIGMLVAYLSIYRVQADDSALASSAITLLVGVLVGLVGLVLLLIGLFNTKRQTRYLYY